MIDHSGPAGNNGEWPEMELVMVDPRSLQVDPRYQRAIRKKDLRKLITEFDRMLFHPIIVGEREDGSRFIIDGHHRADTAIALNIAAVPAVKMSNTTQRIEAGLFGSQTGAPLGSLVKFQAQCVAGDEAALGLQRIVQSVGLTIPAHGMSNSEGYIECVEQLKRLQKSIGDDGVRQVLSILIEAWGRSKNASHTYAVSGMGIIWRVFGGTFDRTRMVQRLREVGFDELNQQRMARQKIGEGYGYYGAFALAIADCYNKRLRDKAKSGLDMEKLRKALG